MPATLRSSVAPSPRASAIVSPVETGAGRRAVLGRIAAPPASSALRAGVRSPSTNDQPSVGEQVGPDDRRRVDSAVPRIARSNVAIGVTERTPGTAARDSAHALVRPHRSDRGHDFVARHDVGEPGRGRSCGPPGRSSRARRSSPARRRAPRASARSGCGPGRASRARAAPPAGARRPAGLPRRRASGWQEKRRLPAWRRGARRTRRAPDPRPSPGAPMARRARRGQRRRRRRGRASPGGPAARPAGPGGHGGPRPARFVRRATAGSIAPAIVITTPPRKAMSEAAGVEAA